MKYLKPQVTYLENISIQMWVEYSFPHFCVKSNIPLHAMKAYCRVLV